MTVAVRTAAAVALAMTCTLAQAADLTVRLDAREIVRNHVHTDLTLAVKSGPLTLVFPKWLPGEHMPSGPLDTLVGMTIRANGQPLTWQRDPKDPFAVSLTVPSGVSHLEIALDSGLPTEGGSFTAGPDQQRAARGALVESVRAPAQGPRRRHLEHRGLAARPAAAGRLPVRSSSSRRPTAACAWRRRAWRASSTRRCRSRTTRGASICPAPLPWRAAQHSIALAADSEEAMKVPEDFAAGYGRLVAQSGMLFGTRMYRHYTWLLTLSDHVAHFGLEHHESSDDRVDENSVSDAPLREGVAELLAHEYVHSWNGKYRRPAGLLSPDYQQPMDGTLLWVYEGMTQFWGTVLPVRAGLIPQPSYREMLASVAGSFDIQGGNRWRPLGDTAVAAQVLYDAPLAWSMSRRDVDFYEASEFLWLNVDTELRNRSGGKVSLDDYVRRFYAGAGGAPALKPFVEQDIYATLAGMVPGDWHAIIHRHLDSLGPQALLEAVRGSGWQLSYSAEKNAFLETEQRRRKETNREWSLGVLVDDKETVVETIENGAAARAGVGPGMKLIAVNGRKYSADVLDAALRAAQASRQPIELLVESADYYRLMSVPYFDGPRWPHLTRIEGTPDLLTQTLTPRSN